MAEEQRAHAILSASGSSIWLHCPPAARLQEQFPDKETEYSREGTWAHSVGAHRLSIFLGRPTEYPTEEDIPGHAEFHNEANNEAINGYVRRCIIAISRAQQSPGGATILLEQRLDYSDWVPDGFGTGDLVVVTDGTLRVRDLKFGKGVQVEAEDNSQLKLYALGAIAAFDGIYDFDKVVVEIDQPRRNHLDGTEPMSVAELRAWAEEYVRPRAALAWDGKGEFAPGDHCTFCRAKATCRARQEAVADLVDKAFEDPRPPELLSPEELAAMLPRLDQVVKWANSVQKYAYEQALKGTKWPGLKLVSGRSNRKIVDPKGLAETLMLEGYEEALIYEPPVERALLGLGALEKLVGKKEFTVLSQGFVDKPPGKPTLVPVSDERPEYTPSNADTDFEEE